PARRTARRGYRNPDRARLRLAGADRRRDHRGHQRYRLHDVRRPPRGRGHRRICRHDRARRALVCPRRTRPGAVREGNGRALGHGSIRGGWAMRTLNISGLRKEFFDTYTEETVTAIDDVSFSIDEGEFVSVLGPSGCGKTTILNIVAGFEKQTSGDVEVGGKAVTGPSPERGVVFQSFALFPWKTVLGNVVFGLRM